MDTPRIRNITIVQAAFCPWCTEHRHQASMLTYIGESDDDTYKHICYSCSFAQWFDRIYPLYYKDYDESMVENYHIV